MAIVSQKSLFSWENIEKLSDLKRLELILKNIPDEKLMRKLESKRRNGRNDYPVRAMWNSMLAGVVFDHERIETLRRELKRNPALLEICGFDLFKKGERVPPAYVYTRFLRSLLKEGMLITEMFHELVEKREMYCQIWIKNTAQCR